MRHSEAINELATALAKAQAEMHGVAKNKTNPAYKSSYADLQSVLKECREPLAGHGLSVAQGTVVEGEAVHLVTLLMHTSGQWLESVYPLRPVKLDPQGYGSAYSYGRRYSLMAMLGIAPEDDDGEAAVGRGDQRQEPRRDRQEERGPQQAARRAVNEQFPRRETWADYSRERLRVANADWMREMVREGVEPDRRAEYKEISSEPREVNQICTRLIEMGRLTATAIAKDGDPAARDPKKARDVVVRLFESKPASVKRAVEKHLAGNLGKARADLGLTEADADDDGAMYPDEVTAN